MNALRLCVAGFAAGILVGHAGVSTAAEDRVFGDGAMTLERVTPTRMAGGAGDDGVQVHVAAPPGGPALHGHSAFVDGERRIGIGTRLGALSLDFVAGSGEDHGRLDDALSLDPAFFHGGSRGDFQYHGAAAELAITRAVNAQFAYARIRADDLDDRHAAYAGIAAGRLTAGVFSVQREDDATAGAVQIAWRGADHEVALQHFQHESGARYRSLAFAGRTRTGHRFDISLGDGRNPLYREGDETRVLFRLFGQFGAPTRLSVNGDEVSEAPPSRTGRNLALLGGAVVAIGVAASSGSDDRDEAIRIRGRDNAARQVLNRINPVSVRENREYGGWIYRNGDGTYGFTGPVRGELASVDIGSPSSVPGGTVASASYHTHGGPDPRFDNENFSPSDILSDNLQRVDGYLGTPAGFMKLHEFRNGRISVLGRINH